METKLKEAVGRVREYLDGSPVLTRADLLALIEAVEIGQPMPTDISKQLREYAGTPGYSHGDYADTMRQAADEIERHHGGWVAWKNYAHDKDRTITSMREQLKAKEVAMEAAHARLLELESPPVFRNDGQEPDWKAYAAEEQHHSFADVMPAPLELMPGVALKLNTALPPNVIQLHSGKQVIQLDTVTGVITELVKP